MAVDAIEYSGTKTEEVEAESRRQYLPQPNMNYGWRQNRDTEKELGFESKISIIADIGEGLSVVRTTRGLS
jgi:hypothetical protein